jgi:hypothetical protein
MIAWAPRTGSPTWLPLRASELVFRRSYSAGDRSFVIDVERQGESIFPVARNNGLQLLRIASGNYRPPTVVKNLLGDLAAKTGGAAGDEPDEGIIS